METASPKNTFPKTGFQKPDFFTWRYLAAWAIFYIFYGATNTAFQYNWNWQDALAILLFIVTVVFGIYFFIRRYKRRAASVLLVLPILWIFDFALTSLGADVVQRSFWLTYPYYANQVQIGRREPFKWAESGWYLGGGSENTLWYEPDPIVWNRYRPDPNGSVQFPIGTSETTTTQKNISGSCEKLTIRRLGGDWYFESDMYGEGLC